jgi:hypothetical protein
MTKTDADKKSTAKNSQAAYDPEIVQEILERIMQGGMLTRICSEEGMPRWQTYYGWMAAPT